MIAELEKREPAVMWAAMLAAETSMRQSELCSAKWSDTDFSASVLNLGSLATKTQSQRAVPLSAAALKILQTIPRNLGSDKTRILGGLTANRCCRIWRDTHTKLRILDLRFHDLRAPAITQKVAELNHVDKYIAGRLKDGAARTTIRKEVAILKRWCNLAQIPALGAGLPPNQTAAEGWAKLPRVFRLGHGQDVSIHAQRGGWAKLSGMVDPVSKLLKSRRAKPTLCIASDQYSNLVLFGLISFDVTIPYSTHSVCNIEIEGLL